MSLNKESLVQYLGDQLGVDTADVVDDTPLFSSGLVDSFALVTLITFIEKECSMRMSPNDVNLDNLDTVERILAYVERSRADAAG